MESIASCTATGDIAAAKACASWGASDDAHDARDLVSKAMVSRLSFCEATQMIEAIFLAGYRAAQAMPETRGQS